MTPSVQTQSHTMPQDQTQTSAFKLKRILVSGMFAYLALLVCYSLYLAQWRIIQVDECQSLYMARILATGQSQQYFTDGSLFLLGPLAWITTHLHQSEQMFDTARFLFLGVFWLNILLMAACAGGKLFSFRGLIALVAAASLAPVWDYGFEIRHDNVILLGMLLIWWTVRVKQFGWPAYLLAGAITVACLVTAVKSVVYVIPLSGALLLLPSSGQKKSRLQLIAAWIGGCILAAVLIRIAYGSSGAWDTYLATFRTESKLSVTPTGGNTQVRFGAWVALDRLPEQTPLLIALSFAAFVSVAMALIRKFRSALTWDGYLPEALLCLGALGDLFLNPTPFPYNVLHLVPYAFILSFRYAAELWTNTRNVTILRTLTAVVVITNFVPFIRATERHLNYSNVRQKTLMNVAELMTDPDKDPVYDGIGMVPTRMSIHHQWYLHSLNLDRLKTPGLQVHEMLAARPAAVLIFSYRTTWLPKKDMDFISTRYVPLTDDFSVLGTALPAGGGTFEIFHPGRYCVIPASILPRYRAAKPPGGEDAIAGTLDGAPIPEKPIELNVGSHKIETFANRKLAVVWVGPTLQGVPALEQYDYLRLFENWY